MKPSKFRRIARWGLAVLILALIAIQFVPVHRTNPPAGAETPFPEEVRAILHRSCYDCHSNKTVWPWYSRIAPLSWLIAHDVNEARGHLNFSAWNRLGAGDQAAAIKEIWEEVSEGEMPLWYYLPAHPEARLTEEDLTVLRVWSQAAVPGQAHDDR